MRGQLQDMITDAIVNVCGQPSVAPAHLFALAQFPLCTPLFSLTAGLCPLSLLPFLLSHGPSLSPFLCPPLLSLSFPPTALS